MGYNMQLLFSRFPKPVRNKETLRHTQDLETNQIGRAHV